MTASLPQDAWYAVGGGEDLPPGAACAVALFGRDIAAWRGRSGIFHAWDNRCVHRGMRLSFGRVRGDRLLCAYHGWAYDETGRCCSIPSRPDVPPSDKIRTLRYEAMEQDGLLWVNLKGAGNSPPALNGRESGGEIAFVQSIVLPQAAEALEVRIRRAIFPLAAWDAEETRPWRYRIEGSAGDTVTARWSSDREEGGEARSVVYHCSAPYPGIIAVTAETGGCQETRILALQPQSSGSSALHVLVKAEAAAPRPAAARWARRLRWFLEQDRTDTVAYRPWQEGEKTA